MGFARLCIELAFSASRRIFEMGIKQTLTLMVFACLTFSCASSSSDAATENAPEVSLVQTYSSADTMYMRGPITLGYQLIIENKTNQALRLTRLDLQTVGAGAYSMHTGASPMNQPVGANGTTNVKVSAWGQARGGFLTADEPVNIRGLAYFTTPSGSTIRRVFTQVLGQNGH
jgi:hypothetical protein